MTCEELDHDAILNVPIRSQCTFSIIGFYSLGLNVRKPVFGGLRTTQAQTSLRIRAV